MNIRVIAAVFGGIFIVIGIAGFIPVITENHLLFNLFMVDTAHNVIHLVSGAIALIAAMSIRFSILYFRVIGVIYALVALLGFFTADLIIIHVNMADNLLHLVIALIALYLGFFYHEKPHVAPAPKP